MNELKITELKEIISNNDESLKEKARQHIIDEQLKKFKKNYVIEYTPLGNVLLFYNHVSFFPLNVLNVLNYCLGRGNCTS